MLARNNYMDWSTGLFVVIFVVFAVFVSISTTVRVIEALWPF